MEELKDIQGLDQISAWPLALGWWLIIALLSGLLIGAAIFAYRHYKYRKSWQFDCYAKLQDIETELNSVEHKILLQDLNAELKRIAMQTKIREACAGLAGKQWLQWLQEHDPRGFDWKVKGQLLLASQYMPTINVQEISQIQILIAAAKEWVRKC